MADPGHVGRSGGSERESDKFLVFQYQPHVEKIRAGAEGKLEVIGVLLIPGCIEVEEA